MKAPSFWYKQPGLVSTLLSPLGFMYRAGRYFRRGLATPYHAKVPVICVGNIVAGGAGKTPTAIAIAEILKQHGHKPVFVTRGYGGREKGPLRVDPAKHTVDVTGDEALLLARTAPIWIGRDRAATIKEAEQHATHVILDDGLQNPSVVPNIALLVVDGSRGFGNECLIPAGPLRETYAEAMKRVTAVVLIGERDEFQIGARVQRPLLRAKAGSALPVDFPRDKKFLAFAGIAWPKKFYDSCKKEGLQIVDTESFPDHHRFTDKELTELKRKAATQSAALLTTEKDWVRLPKDMKTSVAAFPIKLVFEDEVALKRILKV